MDKVEEEVLFLVKQLAKSLKKYGVKKVTKALDELDVEQSLSDANQRLIDYTVYETCKSFMVNPSDLKKKNIRGAMAEARTMCFILLKKHLDLTHEDIVRLFNRSNHSLVSLALSDFKKLDYEIKMDRRFLDIFKEVSKGVEEQKKLLWMKHG